ncbi:HpsJ family protein [Synechocystis sp. B12]|nr:HpsJ family protein [Synechocystis sp. B12]
MPIYILAIALGLVFLLLIPIHLTNVNQIKTAELDRLETQIGQGQEQVEGALRQFDALSQNPEALEQQIQEGEQLLASGQANGNPLNQEQLANIERQVNELKAPTGNVQGPDRPEGKNGRN